jgi:hypothetical protein
MTLLIVSLFSTTPLRHARGNRPIEQTLHNDELLWRLDYLRNFLTVLKGAAPCRSKIGIEVWKPLND